MEAMMVEEEAQELEQRITIRREKYEEEANNICRVRYADRIVSSTHPGQSILTMASMASTVLRRVCCRKRVSNLKFDDERNNLCFLFF
jgi:hypothetical protein